MAQEPTVETVSGRKIGIVEFRYTDFDIEDMARALANKCRFGGHIPRFYSVAEHSIHVAQALWGMYHREDLQLAGLLHEVDEYITTIDFPSPYKPWFKYMDIPISDIAEKHQREMCYALKEIYRCKIDLTMDILDHKHLHLVDKLVCNNEKLELHGKVAYPNLGVIPSMKVECLDPETVYHRFLEYFRKLAYGTDNQISRSD